LVTFIILSRGECWRQLQRWHIDHLLRPTDCDVRFRDLSQRESQRPGTLLLFAMGLTHAVLVTALITQRRRRRKAELALEQQQAELAHAGRLVAVGQLTASITHEVCQPLMAIQANTEAADSLLKAGDIEVDAVREMLADVRTANVRASQVVTRLRALLAKRELARVPVDVNAMISDALRVLEPESHKRQIELMQEADDSVPEVLGDGVHLQQVVLNLVINAMDAMADTPRQLRRVVVRTSRSLSGVEVAVIDHGTGVAPDRMSQLFDSFFTTKSDGMGLGLSISRSIVEAHGGRIWLDIDRRDGATFYFSIPNAVSTPSGGAMRLGHAATPSAH
jgi:C4-dicarboxylate-specific signal transduction histidine kinase